MELNAWFWIWIVTFLMMTYYWWERKQYRAVSIILSVLRKLEHGNEAELNVETLEGIYKELKSKGII